MIIAMLLIGSHIPTTGGPPKAIDRALEVGCTTMQIFVKNNMQWFAKPLEEKVISDFLDHPRRSKLHTIVAHAGYLINLGVLSGMHHQKSLDSLHEELVRCDQLGIGDLVLHPGSHLGAGIEQGLNAVISNINTIHQELPENRTRIALETTAGQGSTIGSRFEEIATILAKVDHPQRLSVCLDTAHIFAAGYNIADNPAAIFATFDQIIGLNRLSILHLNDSKVDLGTRVDRHQNIGKGKIGLQAFQWIFNNQALEKIPKILETPKDKNLTEDRETIAMIKNWL